MNPWLETIGVMLLAVAGACIGYLFSRLRKPYWFLGYLPPLVLAVTIALARMKGVLAFKAPFSWVTMGHREFVIMSLILPMPFATLIPKLRKRRVKNLVALLVATVVFYCSVMPFLLTALVWKHLANLEPAMTADGICLQNTSYTCGPAAAVTVLKRLGLRGKEGEIAILSHTNAMVGTDPDSLCAALHKLYGADGVSCLYRHFTSIAELKEAGVSIAVIKHAPLIDHYVAVLEITEDEVIVGDPRFGKSVMSHAEFEEVWRRRGIVISRRPPGRPD